ncbi:MAG TPA: NAD+ synthase [Gemmatimonadales bacterium]|nr:NAD+ synthase [Gemmatimonadales bacterium]
MPNLGIAQIRPVKADYNATLARLEQLFAQLATAEDRPHVLHLPETALTGYFLEGGVLDAAVTAGTLAGDLDAAWRRARGDAEITLDVVAGFYEQWRNTLYNSAIYVRLGDEEGGDILHVHRKNFLPTYGMFDEQRYVEAGLELSAFDTPWGRAGLLVCEDAWHSLTGSVLALDGAQIVFVCVAAPARGMGPGVPEDPTASGDPRRRPANAVRWERLVREMADEHGVFVSMSNLVGSEAGKLYTGSSALIGPSGDVRAQASAVDEQVLLVRADLEDISRVRAGMPLLADLRTRLPHLVNALERVVLPSVGSTGARWDAAAGVAGESREVLPGGSSPVGAGAEEAGGAAVAAAGGHSAGEAGSAPFVLVRQEGHGRGGPPSLEIDPELLSEWLCNFLRDEMRQRGFDEAILGLSGGVDSAVTAFLAARSLGAEKVLAVRMPYRTSSAESLEHARLVVEALGVRERTVDITAAVDGYLEQEPDADDRRRGNVMARMRMVTLFDLSARHLALPLGTGNKTERLMGYFTWHADDAPPVNPLGDLYKTQVWELARYLGVPLEIVEKPATADLVRGQTDEGDLGISYPKADEILNWLLHGYTVADLEERGMDPNEVRLVSRRLNGTHWKRRGPTVPVLSSSVIEEWYRRPVDY